MSPDGYGAARQAIADAANAADRDAAALASLGEVVPMRRAPASAEGAA